VTPVQLGDRYQLDHRIASGGMGAVWRAVDRLLDRPVAVKLLRREFADDPAFVERFRREARAAAALTHPNVAGVFDYGERDGQAFIVMELVEGENLAERLARTGPLAWPEALALAEQVARALAAAHAGGLVHRDVKPANVLVTPDDHVYLTDFGLSKRLSGKRRRRVRASSSGRSTTSRRSRSAARRSAPTRTSTRSAA
jgi:eukaryotic-like serine/threonine-protein kinase